MESQRLSAESAYGCHRSLRVTLPLLLILLSVFLGCEKETTTSPRVIPETGATIWGHYLITISSGDPLDAPEVDRVTYDAGEGATVIVDGAHLTCSNPGSCKFVICAECIEAARVKLTVWFSERSGLEPVELEYGIDHLPVLTLTATDVDDEVVLDASSSHDPEGGQLQFTWFWDGQTVDGSQVRVRAESLADSSIAIQTFDGVTIRTDRVFRGPGGVPVVFTDYGECEEMTVRSTGASLLNPGFMLGPHPPEGTQLPVDASGALTRSVALTYWYEVDGKIRVSPGVLDEGQDVAASFTIGTRNEDHEGRRRKDSNRSEYETGLFVAPFPDPPPQSGGSHSVNEDDYDNHPTGGRFPINTQAGMAYAPLNVKGSTIVNGEEHMVWLDAPGGDKFPAGGLMGGQVSLRYYFRAWMTRYPPCEKFFTVEIEVDPSSVVSKNRLVEL